MTHRRVDGRVCGSSRSGCGFDGLAAFDGLASRKKVRAARHAGGGDCMKGGKRMKVMQGKRRADVSLDESRRGREA